MEEIIAENSPFSNEAKFMHKRISLLPEGIKCHIQRVQFIENRNVYTVTATLQAADQPKLMFCKI